MFQFKQFAVQQLHNAMKVCTDSCLFGAIIELNNEERILDIGTGTGLLSLMLAQRSEAQIEAVEISPEAAQEANFNFQQSPWRSRLNVHTIRIQDFHPSFQYDSIVCNPPFFKNSLRSPNASRNKVMQQEELSFPELISSIAGLLHPNGSCWILLPNREMEDFKKLASQKKLFQEKEWLIYNREGETPIRSISKFSFNPSEFIQKSICIYQSEGYTSEFIDLLKPYYLKL